jgi:hypothetical protein
VKALRAHPLRLAILIVSLVIVNGTLRGAAPNSRSVEPAKTWQAAKRTATRTHWHSVTTISNAITRQVTFRTNSFVELGTGLNVRNAQGEFVAANPGFAITATGAEAQGAAHQVEVPGDIASGDGIRIVTPNRTELVLQPLAIDYYDPKDGRSILLASITNAMGWLTAPGEIVFSNCFTRLKASVRLRNTVSGFESDLILHERPPDPETLGLSSAARLEMLTEQLSGATPVQRQRFIRKETNPAKRMIFAEPDFGDAELNFNGMSMVVGKAFGTPNRTKGGIETLPRRVGKSYLSIENRNILIEAVEHQKARSALNKLPLSTHPAYRGADLNPKASLDRLAQTTRSLPTLAKAETAEAASRNARLSSIRPVEKTSTASDPTLLASVSAAEPAFVLDYHLVNVSGETDLTFRGDTTYWVSTYLSLYGTNVFEGGTVVKFSDYSGIFINNEDTILCDTANHMPAIFTIYDDNSVGEDIGGSGTPFQYAVTAFYFLGGNRVFRNVRFKHMAYAIVAESGFAENAITLRNVQCLDVGVVCGTGTTEVNVYNGLFRDCGYIFEGIPTFTGEHLTVHNITELGYSWDTGVSSATLRNSLLVEMQNPPNNVGTYNPIETTTLSDDTGVFETFEGGDHYLPALSSYRNEGTTEIDAELKGALKEMTVSAPALLTGVQTTGLDLTRRAIRDTDLPDLGYHYPAVDYVANELILDSGTLTLSGGLTLGIAYPEESAWAGVYLLPGQFISIGTPASMNRILRLNQVHENPVFRGINTIHDGYPDAELVIRFNEFSALANEIGHIYLVDPFHSAEISHSTFQNGSFYCGQNDIGEPIIGLTNNLWRSVTTTFSYSSPYVYLYNNTYIDGAFFLDGGASTWRVYDNVFDKTARTVDSSPIQSSHNIYAGLGSGDQDPLVTDVWYDTFDSLSYGAGPLGRFYGPDDLVDQGSRDADDAGLFHFTTRTNQVREGTTAVDIGFHYVALDTANQALDFDGDTLADYFEDSTGNGLYGDGDLGDFQNKDSDGDGLDDAYEHHSTHTTVALADTGTTGTSDGYKDSDSDGLTNQEEMQLGTDPLVPNVAQPLFSPVGGSYASAQTVTISCPTTGATIRYTTDGNEPTTSSTAYSSPISISANTVLKAKAWKTGWITSDTEGEGYVIEASPSNEAPTVSLLPGTGLAFNGSDSIELLVQAEDTDGTVAKVQLFRGSYKIAEAAGGVLRFTLHNIPSGSYSFTARAIDDDGSVTVSSSVSITIASSGAVVSLFGAQPFFTSSPGALVASITGVNPGNLSSVTLNGNVVPARAGEFLLFPGLAEGENTFTLLVNGTISASTKVYLDSSAPAIAITAPANSSSLTTERINVTGTYTESSLKRIIVNGVLAFTGSGAFEARNVPLVEGSQKIVAVAEDIAGNATSTTNVVSRNTTPTDPVQLTVSPVAGFVSLSTTFTISANVPGTLQNVYYDFDGDGITDQTETSLASISHSYTSAGQFFPVVTIQTTAGRFSSPGGWNAPSTLRVNVQATPSQIGSDITIADPVDLKVGPSAHLYILSRSGELVKEYDAAPAYVRSITLPSGSVPTGLDVDANGNVYVALSGHHQVAKYKLTSGTYGLDTAFNGTGLIGKSSQTSGTGNGEFNMPFDVAVSPDSTQISVSDSANHRIQLFNASDGTFISKLGASGSGVGQFNTPRGLTYDGSSYLYIVDSGNNRVAVALSSSVIGTSGSSGSALGQFSGAVNIGVGPRGIYVGETGNNRVQVFDSFRGDGSGTTTLLDTRLAVSSQLSLSQPYAVAASLDFLAEKIYIADTGNGRVLKASLPEAATPDAVWNAMKTTLLNGNIDQAASYFSHRSAEIYRRSFAGMGSTAIASVMNKTVTPVAIDGDTAQYYFQDTIHGDTITFPVEFVRENGVWKILEF